MPNFQDFFNQYSIETVLIIVFFVIAAIYWLWKIKEDIEKKIRDSLKAEFEQTENYSDRFDSLEQNLKKTFDDLNKKMDDLHLKTINKTEDMHKELTSNSLKLEELKEKINSLEEAQTSTQERLQSEAKIKLIDAYHRYKKAGYIDTLALQNLENVYNFYRQSGGDSYIETLMKEVRAFPKVVPEPSIDEDGR